MALSFFGLYYILIDPPKAWNTVRPFIPVSDEKVEYLRVRFGDATSSTIIDTGIIGLFIGPLALTYFFELVGMYKKEYLVNGR